ncbi:MAG: PSD1 and planctomycete cytochrome C domain-containing protein [Planctomycetota bacterium]|nr:PSD1 and planctomycete cytochrome C domain-containing protein [Planctomycetota bacterium]
MRFTCSCAAIASLSLLIVVQLVVPSIAEDRPSKEIEFARDILPILSDRCFQCHGPDAKVAEESELRLDLERDVKRDRGGYAVVRSGDPEHSKLYQRIITDDGSLLMPPEELDRPLSDQQKDLLKRWIESGAEWGKHWAFERIERPNVGDPTDHPVDYFIDKNLENTGLIANPPADKGALLRRLSFDLTGLPPTPEELNEFEQSSEPDAWQRIVAKKLASQAYGERMAWDWLEAARYADTNGYQGDRERTMWPWRDWVVKAFNDNLPYDQFTVWQVAGDQLTEATPEQILATGFFRNHMINGEGGRIPEENRLDYVMEMTETMGTVWLGLTLNCCRCHDHKFDPLLQKEYFQLTAFFNQTPVNGGGGDPQTAPVLSVASPQQAEQEKELLAAINEARGKLKEQERKLAINQPKWEELQLALTKTRDWKAIVPVSFRAKEQSKAQQLELLDNGNLLTSGGNPDNDAYELEYELDAQRVTAIRLDAIRHPSMTGGGLARSNSGNFVLTDFALQTIDKEGITTELKIARAKASFEQGSLKIEASIDSNPGTGWAVWNGKNIDRDHAAVFELAEPTEVEQGTILRVQLKFNSVHTAHNLGHFRLGLSSKESPPLEDTSSGLQEALAIPQEKRNAEQKKQITEAYHAMDQILTQLKKQVAEQQKRLDGQRKEYPKVMVLRDRGEQRQTFILNRGQYNQPQDEVQADTPGFLPPLSKEHSGKRIDLARWLVHRDNPLTARVTVNRFWQMLFGIGLVKTTEDFGLQSEYPKNKELLDWLAIEFIESGWDVKHLLTLIVTSDAYRRSSRIGSKEDLEMDPENRFFARGPRYRLPSWMLHDQALHVSGLLDQTQGGPSVFPYQPEGIWKEATFGKKSYKVGNEKELYRRSLYTYWRRIVGPTMFFDSGKRQVCEVKPIRTNTPMHALTTLNEFSYVESAKELARACIVAVDNDAGRLQWMSKRVLCRELSQRELAIWKRSLQRATEFYSQQPVEVDALLGKRGRESQESSDLPARLLLAAWTNVCLNVLNLDETLSKE